jgi:hypothetical protein
MMFSLISFQDIIAGVLIGAVNESWPIVLVASIGWGVISWIFVSITTGKAEYKPGTRVFFGSAALSRFIVWWTTAFCVSLFFASATYLARRLL